VLRRASETHWHLSWIWINRNKSSKKTKDQTGGLEKAVNNIFNNSEVGDKMLGPEEEQNTEEAK
jgi:hypothetical protein